MTNMPTQSNIKTSFTQCPFCYGSNENHHEPCRSGGGVFAMKNKNNWEEEFDRVFGIETDQMLPHYKKYRGEVKSFIRSLLHTTRQKEIEKIEKMVSEISIELTHGDDSVSMFKKAATAIEKFSHELSSLKSNI